MGHNVFITGGCGLLGSAVAEEFRRAGYRVIILDTRTALSNLVSETPFDSHCFDVSETAEQKAELIELERNYGPIKNWVNCAYPRTPDFPNNILGRLDPTDWHINTTTHMDSICLLSSTVADLMASSGGGNIVNVASIYGMVSPRFSIYPRGETESPPVYSAIKAGIINYSRYLACYFASKNVRVNCVSPGGISNNQSSVFTQNYNATVPMGRLAKSSEIAGPILFLCSDRASYVTGVNLPVDGGWTAL